MDVRSVILPIAFRVRWSRFPSFPWSLACGGEHVQQFTFTLVGYNAITTIVTGMVSIVVGIAGARVAWWFPTNHSKELRNGDFKMRTMPNVAGRGIALALSLLLAVDGGDGHPPANGTCGLKPCKCGCCWVSTLERKTEKGK